MKAIVMAIVMLCLNTVLSAQPANNLQKIKMQTQDSSFVELNVLSWNIYLLPTHIFMNTAQKLRAQLIADTLLQTNYDVIIFSEAFHPKARRLLAKALKPAFPYQTEVANKGFGIKINSGVWIVSKLPIALLGEIKFEDCKGFDCLSRKGAILVSIQKNGKTMQILGTHLQSGAGVAYDTVRCQQYRQIYQQLLAPNEQEKVVQIVAGDMNTYTTYNKMLSILDAQDGTVSSEQQHTWATKDYGNATFTFDHILLRPNNAQIIAENRQITRFTQPWIWKQKLRQDLSDHYGIALNLRIAFD